MPTRRADQLNFKLDKLFFALFLLTALSQPCWAQAEEQGSLSATDSPLSSDKRNSLIEKSARLINELYFSPEVARRTCDFIHRQQKQGKYDNLSDPANFATTFQADLQAISQDKHLMIQFDPRQALTDQSRPLPKFSDPKIQTYYNHGFEEVATLPGNVGYLKMILFAMVTDEARSKLSAAMGFLKDTDALIIDLRDSQGGDPEMFALIASYFLAKPQLVLNEFEFKSGQRYEVKTQRIAGKCLWHHAERLCLDQQENIFCSGISGVRFTGAETSNRCR